MSGIASFAHARELSTVSAKIAWDAATQGWAKDEGCAAIDTEGTSEFFRVWLACIMYGCCLTTMVAVPYCLCSNRRDKEFENPEDKVFDFGTQATGQLDDATASADPDLDDPTPDFQKAQDHFRQTSPLTARGKWRGVFSTKVSDLSEVGGIGIELYFRLLRSLGLCFSYLTIFSLPIMIFSWQGDFVPDIGMAFARATVGNLGKMAPLGIPQAERLVIIGCQGMPLVKLTKYFGWCDFFGASLFFVFVAWYRFKFIPEAAKRDDADNITVQDFSLEIDLLPRKLGSLEEQKLYEQNLYEHVTNLVARARQEDKRSTTKADAKVAEVYLVRDFDQRLMALRQQSKLQTKVDIAKAYGKEAYAYKYGCCGKVPVSTIIDKNNAKLSQVLKPEQELDVLRAYVILNSPDDKWRLLRMFRFANFRLGRCCQASYKRFHGHAIRMRGAPEPSNILWPNQDVPWQRKLVLKSIMIMLFVIALLASLLLNYMAQRMAREQGTEGGVQVIGESSCDSGTKTDNKPPCTAASVGHCTCNANLAMNWTLAFVQASMTNKESINCFCTSQGYQTILENSTLRDGVCNEFLTETGKTTALGIGASLVVVVMNIVLKGLINFFVDKEHHTSVSARDGSIMLKVAVAQTLNTACIVFLLNYHGLGMFTGDYSDFERGWYAVVGSALCLNMLLNSFTAAAAGLATAFMASIQRCPCSTRKMRHQAELIKVYTNPPFNVATRYAQILTTCFCTLIYSPGLPIINFFAVIFFFINFWVDKYLLLRASRRPPAYDSQMPKQVTEVLLFAVPMHLLFSIAMYSHECTFPSKALGGSLGSMADQYQGMAGNVTEHSSSTNLTERATRESTWMSFLALAVIATLLALLILKAIVGTTFGGVAKACWTACCKGRHQVAPEEAAAMEEVTWDKAWQWIEKQRPPASYRLENSRDNRTAMRFLAEAVSTPASGAPPLELKSPEAYQPEAARLGGGSDDAAPLQSGVEAPPAMDPDANP